MATELSEVVSHLAKYAEALSTISKALHDDLLKIDASKLAAEATKPAKETAKSKKRQIDPNAPRKPMSAYQIFSKVCAVKFKAEFTKQEVKQPMIFKLCGHLWKSVLTDAEKAKFQDGADELKKLYETEKAAYDHAPPAEADGDEPSAATPTKKKKKQ